MKIKAEALAYAFFTPTPKKKAALKQSQRAATCKQAAFDIDDETGGRQTKKQKFTSKGVIPTSKE